MAVRSSRIPLPAGAENLITSPRILPTAPANLSHESKCFPAVAKNFSRPRGFSVALSRRSKNLTNLSIKLSNIGVAALATLIRTRAKAMKPSVIFGTFLAASPILNTRNLLNSGEI